MTICWDKWIIRDISTEMENILEVNGADYALSYLKQCILVPPYSESPAFLSAIRRLKPVRELLSQIDKKEADVIKNQLGGANDSLPDRRRHYDFRHNYPW